MKKKQWLNITFQMTLSVNESEVSAVPNCSWLTNLTTLQATNLTTLQDMTVSTNSKVVPTLG